MVKKIAASALIILHCCAIAAYANASAVEITVPENAKAGSVITITVKVIHNANNIFHFTDWAWIKVDGKEVARWDFTWNHRPESNIFTREISYTVTGPAVVSAKANCNLHGSAGERSAAISVK